MMRRASLRMHAREVPSSASGSCKLLLRTDPPCMGGRFVDLAIATPAQTAEIWPKPGQTPIQTAPTPANAGR